jgi:agmatine/peptidylarginine deiminase
MNQRNGHIENKTKIEGKKKNLKSRRTCWLGGGVEGDQSNAAEEEVEGCE